MTLTDRLLQWRKSRAIRRHDHAAYFKIVAKISKRQVEKMVKEKLARQ